MLHMDSKTMAGLAALLVCIMALALFGKLTAEAVEAIKWIGGTFMGVRAAVNVMENMPGKAKDE